MEGVRTTVLPLNQEAADDYFSSVWEPVHTLTAAAPPDDGYGVDKFTLYLDTEEAQLIKYLQGVGYVIDGVDTLAMITGRNRIEKVRINLCIGHNLELILVLKTLFPLLYLLMKRHYEIMRIMRTKVVDARELSEGSDSILCVYRAVRYRIEELTSVSVSSSFAACYTYLIDPLSDNFSQQRLDPKKHFKTFTYGIVSRFSPIGRSCLPTRVFCSSNMFMIRRLC
jgi:hypothetical protein